MPDWRDPKRIRYRVRDLLGTGLMIFLLKLGSRRQWNEERGRDQFDSNVCAMLYAGEPTFRLCEAYGWKYLIVLADEDLPSVWQRVEGFRPLMKHNRRTRQQMLPNGRRVRQRCRWTTDLPYHGQTTVHVLEYEETVDDQEPSRWVWITNDEPA